ncbi:hypothetical protein [Kangiella sediminilitoris]|uniref:Transmembrane protein n=1 Tax=Kangiella sediminilitoris TaxID=1144748 RepID=A0A1B3BD68_9GAMM|nr:hypothetical protein [Kangiella sediminilitoris]AOE50730.1 hypothetical protein KS2013_2025 [Kangiella sediminilitoris]
MNIIKDLGKGLYTLLFIAPLFWIIPALIEGIQHFVEVQLGMFTLGDSVEPGTETVIRLAFGFLKVLGIIVPSLLILKLSAQHWDKSKLFPLTTFERNLILVTAVLVLAALIFVTYFGASFTAWLSTKTDIPASIAPFIPLLVLLLPMFLFRDRLVKGLLKLCGVHLEGELSPKSYLFELLYTAFPILLVGAPMVLHYKLNGWAMGTQGWELFGLLSADSVLVGLMALLIGLSFRLAVTCVYSKELKKP